jgi:hypothetical protein
MNPVQHQHQCNKHIEVDLHFVHDWVVLSDIRVSMCPRSSSCFQPGILTSMRLPPSSRLRGEATLMQLSPWTSNHWLGGAGPGRKGSRSSHPGAEWAAALGSWGTLLSNHDYHNERRGRSSLPPSSPLHGAPVTQMVRRGLDGVCMSRPRGQCRHRFFCSYDL